MTSQSTPGGQVSARRLAELLGAWRGTGSRQAAADLGAGVRLLALDGRLPAGTRLPAERELADALAVSRTMVAAALERLRAGGMVASRRGAGSWITLPRTTHPVQPPDPAETEMIDLARAAPEAAAGLAAALDAARLRLPEHLSHHGYHQRGLPELRERIAARYAARGLPTTPEQIVVTSGAHQAFVLVLRMLTGPGDRVLVEQPTYPNALDAIRAAHTQPVGVALKEDDWCLSSTEAALRQSAPKLAYFVPDFQNPTGLRLSAPGRERLAAALRRTRTLAVADETLVELALDSADGPPPMAAFAEDFVITVGSASKSYWGGLRLGWIRASADLVDTIVTNRSSVDLGAALFEQLVLTELLAEPEPVLAAQRSALRERRDVLAAGLAEHCPQWNFRLPGGGLSLWCELDGPISTRLAVAAEGYGLRLAPGSRFGVHGGLERWLRVPFGLPPDTLRAAAAGLGRLAAAVGGATSRSTGVPVAVS